MIDEIFRKKLADHASPISSGAFEGVMGKLGVVGAKRSFGLNVIWLLIAGVLLVGSGAYLSNGQDPLSSENKIESASNNITQAHISGIEEPQTIANTDNSSIDLLDAGPNADHDIVNSDVGHGSSGALLKNQQNEAQKAGLPKNNMGNSLNPKEVGPSEQTGHNVASKRNNSSPNGKLTLNASSQNISVGGLGLLEANPGIGVNGSSTEPNGKITYNSNSSSLHTKEKSKALVSTSFDSKNFTLMDNGAERTNTELPMGLLAVSIRPTALKGTKPLLEPVSLSLSETPHGPKAYKLFVDVIAGHYALSGNWVNRKNEGDLRETTETFTNANSFGMRAGVQLKNDWTFSAGLIYNKLSSQVEFNKVRYDTTIQFTFSDTAIYNQVTQQLDSIIVAQIGSANSVTATDLKTTNTYNTLQIPLSAGYHQNHGRFRFAVNAGMSFDLLLSKTALYPVLYRESSTAVIQEPSEEIATLQQSGSSIRSGISFFGNFSVSYLWTEKTHVFFEPTYRSATIPLKNGGGTYFKPNYLGVQGGVRYYF